MDTRCRRAFSTSSRVSQLLVASLIWSSCAAHRADDPCELADGADLTSRCSSPRQLPAHYIEQSLKYFDTFDVSADPESKPRYAERVARWEWPPWLKLTGYGREVMDDTARLALQADPSTVPERDCRAFDAQPFGRCHVVFEYEGGPCPIYEEFTFNDSGEITFIEAWTDTPEHLPTDRDVDRWAEGPEIARLSTRVPGLGSPNGRIDPSGRAMKQAAEQDPDLADFVTRAQRFWPSWLEEFNANGEDIYARGCGWK